LRQVRAATFGHYHELLEVSGGIRRRLGTHVFGEVASLVALAALDALGRTRLRALLGVVALLLAVLAGVGVDALLGTITGTVTDFLAVDTGDLGLVVIALGLLLLAILFML
jgi:hypothetical protein